MTPGTLVRHPTHDLGPSAGRVVRSGDYRGAPSVLVEGLAALKWREWWPVEGLTVIEPAALFSGRALTLRSPWPFAVHALDKRCENRVKPPPAWLVGPEAPWVALHTGAHDPTSAEINLLIWQAREAEWAYDTGADGRAFVFDVYRVPFPARQMVSLIAGVFRILSVDAPYEGDLTGWRAPDCYGYRIDYRPLATPIFCAGPTPKPGKERSTNLGWWEVPSEHFATIEAACAASG